MLELRRDCYLCETSQITWVSHLELIRLSSVLLSNSRLEVMNCGKLYANAFSPRLTLK